MRVAAVSFSRVTDRDMEQFPNYDPKSTDKSTLCKHLKHSLMVVPEEIRPISYDSSGKMFQDPLTIAYDKDASENTIQSLLVKRWGGGGVGRKQGNFHRNLNGKRQNNCFRGVIISNLSLALDCVGIPEELRLFKMDFTQRIENCAFPMTVDQYSNSLQIKMLQLFDVDKGAFRRAMPNMLVTNSNIKFYRLLKDDDLVILNRQPTLRGSNIVSMRVKLIPGNTHVIQIHPAILSCFDGDLDGDEMNGYIPSTRMDSELLNCKIDKQLIDPIDSSLTASIIQDAMYGYSLEFPGTTKQILHKELVQSIDPAEKIFKIYEKECQISYEKGISADFSCQTIDHMIDCGAKGKPGHKSRFRQFIDGIYDDDQYIKHLQDSRDSIVSKTLRTGESGHINRQLSYLLDDLHTDGVKIYDIGKFIVSFDISNLPEKLQTSPKIGLYCVTAIIPELTQNVLDSSHMVSSGETFTNIVPELKKVLSCTHQKGKEIYKIMGIEEYRLWLVEYLHSKLFYGKIAICWFELLADLICQTGTPTGIGATESALWKRFDSYFKGTKNRPILKMAKFGNPVRVFKRAAEHGYHDTLETSHSSGLFLK